MTIQKQVSLRGLFFVCQIGLIGAIYGYLISYVVFFILLLIIFRDIIFNLKNVKRKYYVN